MSNNDETVEEDGKIAIKVRSQEDDEDDDGRKKKRSKNEPAKGAFDGKSKLLQPVNAKKKKKNDKEEEDELSEEDKALKEALELCVARICEHGRAPTAGEGGAGVAADGEEVGSVGVTLAALSLLQSHIKTATSSMTAVPKPLKFLSPLFSSLKQTFQRLPGGEVAEGGVGEAEVDEGEQKVKVGLADVLSIVSMVVESEEKGSSLRYKLQGTRDDLDSWGHEYIRHLAGEIGVEHTRREEECDPPEDTTELMELVDQIVPFNISHSAEAEAVDLLMEVRQLPKLLSSRVNVDSESTHRICNYLLRAALYIEDPAYKHKVFRVAFDLYRKQERWCDVLRVALRANDRSMVEQAFQVAGEGGEGEEGATNRSLTRRQMAFLLAQHRYFYYQVPEEEDDAEELNGIIGNARLSQNYHHLATDLDVTEAKDPKDVYKSRLADTGLRRTDGAVVQSAQQSQAATYVNGFVNIGFCKDNLVSKVEEDGTCAWIYNNKPPGVLSATASLGMIHQWDVDGGMIALDKWCNVTDNVPVVAGAVLGIGICNAGFYSEDNDVAFGTIADFLEPDPENIKAESDRRLLRINAITALGLAYAATSKEDVVETLTDIIDDEDEHIDVVAAACLSVGLICVGTGVECDVCQNMLDRLMESTDAQKSTQSAKYITLAVGLVFLGCGESVSVSKAVLSTIEHPVAKYGQFTFDTCAYCGTGDVLMVQRMLQECSEHLTGDDADFQTVAVLGIALITLGERVGMQMAHRTMQHMLQYGELPIRRSVPLSLAVLHLSDPEYSVVDTLSRLSHDPDKLVASNAILAMGLVGCGTNNSRIAGLLKQLSVFYKASGNQLYVVRLAQGLLHMGKGLVTINPYHSDRLLLNRTAIGSLLVILHGALNLENTLLGSLHYHMYYVTPAVRPRMLIAVDEELEPISTTVRVGEAVDTVGQAGHPRTITGFQTHNTPVLLHHHERAVFASDDIEPITSILEGTVVCKKVSPEVRRARRLQEKREAAAAAKAAREAREKLKAKALANAGGSTK